MVMGVLQLDCGGEDEKMSFFVFFLFFFRFPKNPGWIFAKKGTSFDQSKHFKPHYCEELHQDKLTSTILSFFLFTLIYI